MSCLEIQIIMHLKIRQSLLKDIFYARRSRPIACASKLGHLSNNIAWPVHVLMQSECCIVPSDINSNYMYILIPIFSHLSSRHQPILSINAQRKRFMRNKGGDPNDFDAKEALWIYTVICSWHTMTKNTNKTCTTSTNRKPNPKLRKQTAKSKQTDIIHIL